MNKRKYLSIFLLVLIITGVSCDKMKDFGDTNVNPGGSTSPILSALLTNVLAGLPATASQTRGGLYAQYFSETQYTDVSLYSIPQQEFSGIYAGPLNDLQNIITTNQSNNMSAVAAILKSYIYWTITDRWGDVPYSQALKGGSVATPVYDKQEDIYKGILAELKTAVGQFDATSVISGDISNYNGSIAGWKKLGNSLRVLISLRMSKRFPSGGELAATELKAALADPGGVITNNSENFTLVFPGGNLSHPWYDNYNGRKDFGESATMTTLMTSLGDARQSSYGADVNGEPTTLGVPYGWTRAKVDPWTANNPKWAYVLKPSLRTQTSPVVVVPSAVVSLARAEAADRGWTTESVKDLYEGGIRLSYEQWGVGVTPTGYFTQAAVALSAAPGTGGNLKQIATQRYIATYPDGLQGWAEWRRTGYPELTPAPDAVNSPGKQIPRRYTYGTGEYGSNKGSVDAASGLLTGGDKQDSRMWWDM